MERIEEVTLDPKKLDQKFKIRAKPSPEIKNERLNFLQEPKKCFAWDARDMPKIDPKMIIHKLNVDPSFKVVNQKRRKFAP